MATAEFSKFVAILWQLRWRNSRTERSYPWPEGRDGGREELPHAQGKKQGLRFAGAALKGDLWWLGSMLRKQGPICR